MKTSGAILVIFLCLFFVSASSANEQGEEIFKSNGCIFCHKPGRSSGTIPSLPELAKAYKGKQKRLVRYLNGEAGPIVNPERAGTMKRQIEKTKAMSDSDRTALADFMLSH
jgi:cytochrome c551/c552